MPTYDTRADTAELDEPQRSPHRVMEVGWEERHEMIAVAAYFHAERRGFSPGQEAQDWWQAEAEIDRLLVSMTAARISREEYDRVGLRNALRLWVE